MSRARKPADAAKSPYRKLEISDFDLAFAYIAETGCSVSAALTEVLNSDGAMFRPIGSHLNKLAASPELQRRLAEAQGIFAAKLGEDAGKLAAAAAQQARDEEEIAAFADHVLADSRPIIAESDDSYPNGVAPRRPPHNPKMPIRPPYAPLRGIVLARPGNEPRPAWRNTRAPSPVLIPPGGGLSHETGVSPMPLSRNRRGLRLA